MTYMIPNLNILVPRSYLVFGGGHAAFPHISSDGGVHTGGHLHIASSNAPDQEYLYFKSYKTLPSIDTFESSILYT